MDRNFEEVLLTDPIAQFQNWFDHAVTMGAPQAEAMTLATASPEGHPSARIVLLKAVDQRGFVFVTNYESPKGRDLAPNPRAALVFHWASLHRQVRIEGLVERTSEEESDRLFNARERDHQCSSLASRQSEPVTLAELDRRYAELQQQYRGKPIPRPAYWGGYRLRPERMEFWQHRLARMNDRMLYVRRSHGDGWERRRLSP